MSMARLYQLPIALAILAASTSKGLADEPAPVPATIEKVRDVIRAKGSALIALRAEFRSWYRVNAGTRRYEICDVAASGSDRVAHLWHGEYDNPAEDPRAHTQLLTAEGWNVFMPYFRRYDVSRKFAARPYTDKILLHPLFESLGWWPPGDTNAAPRPGNRRFFLKDILEDDRCRVVGTERIGDAWCDVVDVGGDDRLWVDRSRGVVPRRIMFDLNQPGKPFVTLESSDYREVAPGLFLPYQMKRVLHSPEREVTAVVDRYEVNPSRHDWFSVAPPAGTLIYDRDTDEFRQIPGGFEIMDRLVGWVGDTNPRVIEPARSSTAAYAASGLVGVAVGFMIRRRRRGAEVSIESQHEGGAPR